MRFELNSSSSVDFVVKIHFTCVFSTLSYSAPSLSYRFFFQTITQQQQQKCLQKCRRVCRYCMRGIGYGSSNSELRQIISQKFGFQHNSCDFFVVCASYLLLTDSFIFGYNKRSHVYYQAPWYRIQNAYIYIILCLYISQLALALVYCIEKRRQANTNIHND